MLDELRSGELDLIVGDLARTVGAQTGLLAVAGHSGEAVEILGTSGDVPGLDDLPVSLTGGFVDRTFTFERAVLEPLDCSAGISKAPSASLTHAAGVAVRSEVGLTGALCVGFSAAPARRQAHTLRAVESYARLASVCLSEPGILEHMLASAQLDGLTGCLNHVAIQHELEREVRRSERHGLSLSCCFLDLDDFKLVNDRYGHLYGSAALAKVAAAFASAIRSEDTVGRYGGDEFIAILPETDAAAAVKLAERARQTISTLTMDLEHGPVAASIGVAQWQPGFSGRDLIEAADQALSDAKGAGGATVFSVSDTSEALESRSVRQQVCRSERVALASHRS